MEQVLVALHQFNQARVPVVLCIGRYGATVGLAYVVPTELDNFLRSQLHAHFPDAAIADASDEDSPRADTSTWFAEISLRPQLFPLNRVSTVDDRTADPLSSILAAMGGQEHDPLRGRLELVIRPARTNVIRRARRCVERLRQHVLHNDPAQIARYVEWFMSRRWYRRCLAWYLKRQSTPAGTEAIGRPVSLSLHGVSDKLGRHLFEVSLRVCVQAPATQEARAITKLRELAGTLGPLVTPEVVTWSMSRTTKRCMPPANRGEPFLLSAEEVATVWHLPTSSVQAPTMEFASHRQLEPPTVLPTPDDEPDIAVLGTIQFRSRHEQFGMRIDDRRRHLYVVGKTGMGKSTLLQNLLGSDIRAGLGCCLIDPHGDLAEAVLADVPSHRTNDVVFFDAGDHKHPLAFNPLALATPETRPLVASGILTAFKKLYGESWGPRLEHIFRHCLLTLLEVPGTSLLTLVQLLGDARFRQSLVERVSDPIVRAFWLQEFAGMPAKLQAEAIAPIQNKVGQFVASPLLRHIIGQPRSTIDIRRIMDNGQILIVNVSKGRMGEDASSLLGALLITSVQLTAMGRANVPEQQRRDFFLYVDEFQAFATEAFASILSEARKYRLSLTLANQYLDQMDESAAAAVFGNVGSLLCFQLGAGDSEVLAKQLGGQLTPQDLIALPSYEAYVRLLVDGQPSRPFSMRTLPRTSTSGDPRRADIIRRSSQRRYGRPAPVVANAIELAFAGE